MAVVTTVIYNVAVLVTTVKGFTVQAHGLFVGSDEISKHFF